MKFSVMSEVSNANLKITCNYYCLCKYALWLHTFYLNSFYPYFVTVRLSLNNTTIQVYL